MKTLKKFVGIAIIILTAMSATMATVLLFVEVFLAILGENFNEDMLFACLVHAPLLAYFWWAWTSKWSRVEISKFFI